MNQTIKTKNIYIVYLNVYGSKKKFFKCLVAGSLKQLVKNRYIREKNGLEKKQPTWKNRAKKKI